MALKRTAALAVSSFIVLGGGATALAATGTFTSSGATAPTTSDRVGRAFDPSAMPSLDGLGTRLGDMLAGVTVDPDTGAIEGPGFTVRPPATGPDGSATFSGTGPDGRSHSATITPGTDGSRPTVTIDGVDLGAMFDRFMSEHPDLELPDPSTMPSMPNLPGLPSISVPPQVQQFIDRARAALDGAVGGSMPQWPGMPRS